MKNFLYKFGSVSILSFFFSNLLFYLFDRLFIPSIASLITIFIIFLINTQLFFNTRLFKKSRKNYYRLLTLTIVFRVFEFLLFNILYLFILINLKTNYIFLITLIISFLIKTIVYYKNSESDKIDLAK